MSDSDSGDSQTPPRDTQSGGSDQDSGSDENRQGSRKRTRRNIESDYDKIDEELNKVLPLTCSICNKPFSNPVVTKCQHYFCKTCALKHEKENEKCFVCNEPTLGGFDEAVEIKKKIVQQREKAKEMMKEVSNNVEKASKMMDGAGVLADQAVKLMEEVQTLLANATEMASNAGKIAAEAAGMVQEAKDAMGTVKVDMEKAFAVMKTVVWDVSVD